MRDPLVYAVHGDRVLYQVVCSDAEKIDLSCQGVSDQHSTWYLDHDADLDILLERFTLFTQLGLATLQDLFGLAEFGEARDHWKHHPNVAKRADPQSRALKISGRSRQNRIARHPRNGLISAGRCE